MPKRKRKPPRDPWIGPRRWRVTLLDGYGKDDFYYESLDAALDGIRRELAGDCMAVFDHSRKPADIVIHVEAAPAERGRNAK